jgi:hypothetical protein
MPHNENAVVTDSIFLSSDMAGYSGTPLCKKLGIKPGFRMFIQGSPPDYFKWIEPLPADTVVREKLTGKLDFIHLFVKDQKTLSGLLRKSRTFLESNGMIWVSWPKKSSGVETDLSENIIRDHGLRLGLVDIKVCAVDDTWSGLKFVIPLSERSK